MSGCENTDSFKKETFWSYVWFVAMLTIGASLTYVFLGKELGARYEDKSLLFLDGKVDFKKVQTTKSFLSGIERLISGLKKGYKISLMCS